MSTWWQAISNFEQREQDFIEASGFASAATAIAGNESTVTAFLDAEAPQTVATAVAAIEKADAQMPEGGFINTVLNAGEAEIDAELQPLIAQGVALVPALVRALNAVAAKLRAKAAAL
jgi:hypothetical protein